MYHSSASAVGVDRAFLCFLSDAFQEDEVEGDSRTVMRLHPALAPIKAGIFPLVKKGGLPEIAHKLEDDLKATYNVYYDEKGAIGRRYRRQDECGTPYCITIDFDSKDDNAVTIRDRDTLCQDRIALDQVKAWMMERIPT